MAIKSTKTKSEQKSAKKSLIPCQSLSSFQVSNNFISLLALLTILPYFALLQKILPLLLCNLRSACACASVLYSNPHLSCTEILIEQFCVVLAEYFPCFTPFSTMSLPTTAGLYHLDTPAGPCKARLSIIFQLFLFILVYILLLYTLNFLKLFYGSVCVFC